MKLACYAIFMSTCQEVSNGVVKKKYKTNGKNGSEERNYLNKYVYKFAGNLRSNECRFSINYTISERRTKTDEKITSKVSKKDTSFQLRS